MTSGQQAQNKSPELEHNETLASEYLEKVESHVSHQTDDDHLDIENRMAAKPDDSDGHMNWSPKTIGAAIALTGLYVASQIPLYMVGGSLSFIAKDIPSANILWLITANQLCLAAFAPFIGYLTDLIGRRHVTLIGGVAIIVGSILVATAHSFGQAVAGTALAGAGGSIGELSALAGVAELSPVRLRGQMLALVLLFSITFSPYVLYCQLIGNHTTWRWSLWMVVFYTAIAEVGTALLYFPPPRHRTEGMSAGEIGKRVDYLGALFSIAGLAMLLAGLGNGGTAYPWVSREVLVPLIFGVLTLVAFVVWESRFAPHPMVPGAMFKDRPAVSLCLIIIFVCGIFFVTMISYFPLLFDYVYPQLSAIQVGTRSIGFAFGVQLAAVIGSTLVSHTRGHIREFFVFSALMMTAFTAALAKTSPTNSTFPAVVGAFSGFGVGGIVSTTLTVAIVCSPDSIIATVVGLCLATRALGGAIGNTIYGTILNNKIASEVPEFVASYALKAGLAPNSTEQFITVFLTDPANITSIHGVNEQIITQAGIGATYGFAKAFSYVWYASIAFGALAAVCCFLLPNIKKYLTNRVAVAYH